VFTGGERSLGIVREERSFLAALVRMTANNGEGKKKERRRKEEGKKKERRSRSLTHPRFARMGSG
jgi:hypothetical protein